MVFVTSGITEKIQKMLGSFVGVKLAKDMPALVIVKQPKRGSSDRMLKVYFEGLKEDTT